VGQTFGDFELLEELGRGGMGIVYRARQKSLDRVVALKLLPLDPLRKPVLISRFLAEARAAAGLSHPNIVNVFQVGECSAGHYFVMEHIDGQTLDTLMRHRTVPIPWAVSLMVTVTEAVHYAHTKGIVHRDLKPSNIMVDGHRRPVVMDFGIAKFLGKASSLTQEGVVVGTPSFMAPEQAGEDLSLVGPRSDVYSLGAILYTLLGGRPPFCESTALLTILKVISSDPPPPLHSLREDVPAKLEKICTKCLAKKPDDRYPSAQALAEALRRYRAGSSQKQTSLSLRHTLQYVVLIAKESGKELRLFNRDTILGRASSCNIIVKASEVSKRHCRIRLEPDQVVIEDLGSANGTYVNGREVRIARLLDGDEVELGGHVFQVRLPKPTT
jgi:serine/threonine-protein kinase